jgi:hypothetical protein
MTVVLCSVFVFRNIYVSSKQQNYAVRSLICLNATVTSWLRIQKIPGSHLDMETGSPV